MNGDKKGRVYVIVKGRFGNQLFQYAFGRALQEMTGGNLVLDFSELGFNKANGNYNVPGAINGLDNFNISPYEYRDAGTGMPRDLSFRFQLFLYRLFRKTYTIAPSKLHPLIDKLAKVLQLFGVYYQFGTTSFLDFRKPKKGRNILVRGWFESEKYFDSISHLIRQEITPLRQNVSLTELRDKLELSNSICVSIRRGDFTADCYKNEFLVCTLDYYMKGVRYILEKHPDSLILLCSDDVEWCKNNVCFDTDNVIFEPAGISPSETFSLMISCHHFVISNSTFHFWAQFVSNHSDKIVVAPSIWRRSNPPVTDIYMDNWHKIDV